MKVVVLVPCHLKTLTQLRYLSRCLDSLLNQTAVPDIIVSISFENDYMKNTFVDLLRAYPNVKFRLSAEQKYQMEHIYTLLKEIHKYDLVMFCDDDDTYNEERVQVFVNYYIDGSAAAKGRFVGIRELLTNNSKDPNAEYWAYGLVPSIIIEFFDRMKNDMNLLKHKFADMYFRNYLLSTKDVLFGQFTGGQNNNLYNYNLLNPDSICARHKSNGICKESIQDTVILLSQMPDKNDLIDYIKDIPSEYLTDDLMATIKQIKKLISVLYI